MAKIKIEDLPKDLKIGKEDLKRIRGGLDARFAPIFFKSRQISAIAR